MLEVKYFMYTPDDGEYIRDDAELNKAVHRLIEGRHQSLLVTRGDDIAGVLRLTDVFKLVCEKIKACGISPGEEQECGESLIQLVKQ